MQPGEATATVGGVAIDAIAERLAARDPDADAFYAYDLDAIDRRARRFLDAFKGLDARGAYAIKANALPAILETVAATGFGADAGSLGELHLADVCGFPADRVLLNGNGRTQAEADWVAQRGVGLVNADLVPELDVLNAAARAAGRRVRVALRVNPGILTPGHRYIATGDDEAKFGMDAREAVDVWRNAARWEHLVLDGVHVHVGSQLTNTDLLLRAVDVALELVDEAATFEHGVQIVNAGGGLGIDYDGGTDPFPLEDYAGELRDRAGERRLTWVLEPGRWLVAASGVLAARVRWVKQRAGRRFIVLAAGMNDFIRPALYAAKHRIEPATPRPGHPTPATVVGPVCETADVFHEDAVLPPVERGDLVLIRDTGAYGAVMASVYNGRGRLAEVVVREGNVTLARERERPEDLLKRVRRDPL